MAAHIKRAGWEGRGTHQPLTTTTSFVGSPFLGYVNVFSFSAVSGPVPSLAHISWPVKTLPGNILAVKPCVDPTLPLLDRAGHLPSTHFMASQDLTWEHHGSQALC